MILNKMVISKFPKLKCKYNFLFAAQTCASQSNKQPNMLIKMQHYIYIQYEYCSQLYNKHVRQFVYVEYIYLDTCITFPTQ